MNIQQYFISDFIEIQRQSFNDFLEKGLIEEFGKRNPITQTNSVRLKNRKEANFGGLLNVFKKSPKDVPQGYQNKKAEQVAIIQEQSSFSPLLFPLGGEVLDNKPRRKSNDQLTSEVSLNSFKQNNNLIKKKVRKHNSPAYPRKRGSWSRPVAFDVLTRASSFNPSFRAVISSYPVPRKAGSAVPSTISLSSKVRVGEGRVRGTLKDSPNAHADPDAYATHEHKDKHKRNDPNSTQTFPLPKPLPYQPSRKPALGSAAPSFGLQRADFSPFASSLREKGEKEKKLSPLQTSGKRSIRQILVSHQLKQGAPSLRGKDKVKARSSKQQHSYSLLSGSAYASLNADPYARPPLIAFIDQQPEEGLTSPNLPICEASGEDQEINEDKHMDQDRKRNQMKIKQQFSDRPILHETHFVNQSQTSLELFFYPEYYQLSIPEYNPREAILNGKSYQSKLYVPAQLTDKLNKKIKLKWVLIGNLPLMTKHGHFILNGAPRVIVNQIIRSPGIYYQEKMHAIYKNKWAEKPTETYRRFYADLICLRGTWLRIEMDKTKKIWAQMKKGPKIPILWLLLAMGLTERIIFKSISNPSILFKNFEKEDEDFTNIFENENERMAVKKGERLPRLPKGYESLPLSLSGFGPTGPTVPKLYPPFSPYPTDKEKKQGPDVDPYANGDARPLFSKEKAEDEPMDMQEQIQDMYLHEHEDKPIGSCSAQGSTAAGRATPAPACGPGPQAGASLSPFSSSLREKGEKENKPALWDFRRVARSGTRAAADTGFTSLAPYSPTEKAKHEPENKAEGKAQPAIPKTQSSKKKKIEYPYVRTTSEAWVELAKLMAEINPTSITQNSASKKIKSQAPSGGSSFGHAHTHKPTILNSLSDSQGSANTNSLASVETYQNYYDTQAPFLVNKDTEKMWQVREISPKPRAKTAQLLSFGSDGSSVGHAKTGEKQPQPPHMRSIRVGVAAQPSPLSSSEISRSTYSFSTEKVTASAAPSELGRKWIFNKFLNPRNYDLGKQGRARFNKKLGLSIALEHCTLTPQDALLATEYLLKVEKGLKEIDDIDHLRNKRVRTSGQLLQIQVGIGLLRLEKSIRETFNSFLKAESVRLQNAPSIGVESFKLEKKDLGSRKAAFKLSPLNICAPDKEMLNSSLKHNFATSYSSSPWLRHSSNRDCPPGCLKNLHPFLRSALEELPTGLNLNSLGPSSPILRLASYSPNTSRARFSPIFRKIPQGIKPLRIGVGEGKVEIGLGPSLSLTQKSFKSKGAVFKIAPNPYLTLSLPAQTLPLPQRSSRPTLTQRQTLLVQSTKPYANPYAYADPTDKHEDQQPSPYQLYPKPVQGAAAPGSADRDSHSPDKHKNNYLDKHMDAGLVTGAAYAGPGSEKALNNQITLEELEEQSTQDVPKKQQMALVLRIFDKKTGPLSTQIFKQKNINKEVKLAGVTNPDKYAISKGGNTSSIDIAKINLSGSASHISVGLFVVGSGPLLSLTRIDMPSIKRKIGLLISERDKPGLVSVGKGKVWLGLGSFPVSPFSLKEEEKGKGLTPALSAGSGQTLRGPLKLPSLTPLLPLSADLTDKAYADAYPYARPRPCPVGRASDMLPLKGHEIRNPKRVFTLLRSIRASSPVSPSIISYSPFSSSSFSDFWPAITEGQSLRKKGEKEHKISTSLKGREKRILKASSSVGGAGAMTISEVQNKNIVFSDFISTKAFNSALREFFGSNPLSQFMDQINPLAEVTHKRRLTSMGPGGITRDTATLDIRGIHPSHYGRICPIETPEGKNTGLVNSMTTYARVNQGGALISPFYKVYKGQVLSNLGMFFLSSEQEEKIVLAAADSLVSQLGFLPKGKIPVKITTDFSKKSRNVVQYVGVSPVQMISIATSLIPFLEHDDANRALMGSNMQRQAVPLIRPEKPIVGTGFEPRVVCDSGQIIQAAKSGFVAYVSSQKIIVFQET
uniref:DNA-directed RNA polymerase n=1 Tax=Staurocarteria crucifera TaxID=47781 RepID=A0A0S2IBY6_9CHLO|nr:beta subunit of RNA polymerase [Carteria crucifera]